MKKRIAVIICSCSLLVGMLGFGFKSINDEIIIDTNQTFEKDFPSIKNIDVNKDVYVDSDTMVAVVSLEEKNSAVILGREPEDIDLKVANEAFVDFSKGTIGFYNASSPQSDEREIYISRKIDFEIAEKHQYTIRFVKEDGLHLKLILTDDFTGDSALIEGNTAIAGSGWGKRKIECISGSVHVLVFYDMSTQPYNAKVLVIGDSFIEGFSLGEDKDKRYSKLIKDELQGSAFINGQGGAASSSGIIWLKSYLLDIVHPQYAIVAFGMNENDFETWKANTLQIIDILKSNNITPVLVTVTPSGADVANYVHMQMNDFIRESGYLYIDAAKACSLKNDGTTFDESLFMDDKVHPTMEAHELIFEQAKMDVPELFE